MASTTSNHHHLYAMRILNTNSLHFITLSLLFLPLTFFITTIIQLHLSSNINLHNLITLKTVTALITAILSTVTATSLITCSTHQAIRRRPLTFKSTFKSLSSSFIPLLSTFVAGMIKLSLVSLLVTLSLTAVNEVAKSLGLGFLFAEYDIIRVLLITISFYLGNWGSAPAIVVLESKSGFEALRKSANQSIKVRMNAFLLVMVTGSMIALFLYYSAYVNNIESVSKWISIVQVSANHLQSCMMIAYYVVVNSVVFVNFNEKEAKIVDEEKVLGMDLVVNGRFSDMVYLFITVGYISLRIGLH